MGYRRPPMLRRAVRTARGRVALLVLTVLAVMLSTAALLHYAFDQFDSFGEALWSAAVHLVDPGALVEDDDGPQRAMGMFQAVAGLVLLIGVLFELVSVTVSSSIERLGRYDPPVRARDHLLVIGSGELLASAAGTLALASGDDGRGSRVVVLAPEEERQARQRLLAELREEAAGTKIELVFGDTGDDSGFELGAAAAAEAILVLPTGSGPVAAEAADVEVMTIGLALRQYLSERRAEPEVRMLFRRGRNVDAVWGMFPSTWDAIVGDRTIAGVFRYAITGLDAAPEIGALLDTRGGGEPRLLDAARERAEARGGPLRLTIVGCGINAPALLEDLAAAGAERFELAMLAERGPFDTYLGRADRGGVTLRFEETPLDDPERLRQAVAAADPDVVLVTPSPTSWDMRISDAEATLTLLHVLAALGPETPVLAELFLPDSVGRLPSRDGRLLPVSGLGAISAALALSVSSPERTRELVEGLDLDSPATGT